MSAKPLAVGGSVAQRFSDVTAAKLFAEVEISDRASNFKNPVMGTGRQSESLECATKKKAAFAIGARVLANCAPRELRVGHALPGDLPVACAHYALPHDGGIFTRIKRREICVA